MAKIKDIIRDLEQITEQLSDIKEFYIFHAGDKKAKEDITRSRLLNMRSKLMDLQPSVVHLPSLPAYKKNDPVEETVKSFYDWCVEARRILDHRQKDRSQQVSKGPEAKSEWQRGRGKKEMSLDAAATALLIDDNKIKDGKISEILKCHPNSLTRLYNFQKIKRALEKAKRR